MLIESKDKSGIINVMGTGYVMPIKKHKEAYATKVFKDKGIVGRFFDITTKSHMVKNVMGEQAHLNRISIGCIFFDSPYKPKTTQTILSLTGREYVFFAGTASVKENIVKILIEYLEVIDGKNKFQLLANAIASKEGLTDTDYTDPNTPKF